MRLCTKIFFALLLAASMVMFLGACSSAEEYEAAETYDYALEPAEEIGVWPEDLADREKPEEPQEPEKPEEPQPLLVYIALGDSVSAGFGIHSLYYRHSDVFFEMLYLGGYASEYVNMAADGMNTTTLLELLTGLPANKLEQFQSASVITLNIGGNNILLPFLEQLPDAEEVSAMLSEALEFIGEARETISQLIDFFAESRDTIAEILNLAADIMDVVNNFTIADILRLSEFIDRASGLDDATAVFDGFIAIESEAADIFAKASELRILPALSVLTGDFPPQLEAELENAAEIFAYEFAEIITWLKNNAPEALIIVNTVYNPMPNELSGISLEIGNRAQTLIREINQIIYEQSRGGDFIVSDIYSILSNDIGLMNFNLDFIHPNHAGHNLIALRNYEDFLRYRGE